MNPEQFQKVLAERGISLSPTQMDQFARYYELLITTNEHVNLTAITAEADVYLKHFYDSVTPLVELTQYFPQNASICDIGAGAGFPSLPMKILRPDLKVTIVDSLNKRIKFLGDLVAELQLDNVELVHDRAETFSAKNSAYREQFELVTARAVARLSVLSELCLPAVKKGGYLIALKASNTPQEVQVGQKSLNILGGKLIEDKAFELPVNHDERHLLVIEKVANTPKKYPRKPGTPNKEPLGE